MSKPLTVIAKIEAIQEKKDLVKQELLKLIPITLKEEGCLGYTLHQDYENPCLFLFYETWENQDLLQKHLKSDHFQAYGQATKDAVKSFEIFEMFTIENE